MKIPSIITTKSIKMLSELSNNSESIIPMALKDTISNAAIVDTYRKEGGVDDARERAIEEFGTGAVWLFGIPTVKKLINKTVYPFLKLNPDFDVRVLKDEKKLSEIKNELKDVSSNALQDEKNLFLTLDDKNAVLKNFTNKSLYKSLFVAKFIAATGLSAVALSALIKYKQKTTTKRIEQDFYKNKASQIILNNHVSQSKAFGSFYKNPKNNENPKKDVSFKGLGELFMYNSIANTAILDGVITGTRLKEARKGEKKEVGLKEAFQLVFIYGLAKPIQLAFEGVGKKIKKPIGLDPTVLFSNDIKEKALLAKDAIEQNGFLENKTINGKTKTVLKENALDGIYNLAKKDINNPLLELLEKNGVVSIIKDKNGKKEALSYLNTIDEKSLKNSMVNIQDLAKNVDNIKSIKAFKTFAIFANIGIAAWAMGVLQPKVNIAMRKFFHNGDNRNPAIVAQEQEMAKKLS